jgi:hypothetical protein
MDQKFRGIHKHKDGGWVAAISGEYLGIFKLFDDAVEARKKAEIEKFGAVFDRRDIQIDGDVARIPLHGQKGKFYGWSTVDIEDLHLVEQIAWTLDPRGYVAGTPKGRGNNITMHRLLIYGEIVKGGTTDHINGDRTDNRRSNLRRCTQAQNSRNTVLAKNNTSGVKGVSKTIEGKWKARITFERKNIHIGVYDTKEEAAAAYSSAALVLHGDFASPTRIASSTPVE